MATSHVYYIEKNDNSISNIETVTNTFLAEHVSARANLLNIEYIGLQGMKDYCEKIKEDIEDKLIVEYGKKITIEVI